MKNRSSVSVVPNGSSYEVHLTFLVDTNEKALECGMLLLELAADFVSENKEEPELLYEEEEHHCGCGLCE